MIELTEKAAKYAAEKEKEVIANALVKAYEDGYRDGYKDREEEIPVDLRDNKTEYVDLGLPSGTLWAKDFEREGNKYVYLPYLLAQNYNLPTEEQWEELRSICSWVFESKHIFCIGPNGKSLVFDLTGYIEVQETRGYYHSYFWMENSEKNNQIRNAGEIYYNYSIISTTIGMYCGYLLPIRLVKTK